MILAQYMRRNIRLQRLHIYGFTVCKTTQKNSLWLQCHHAELDHAELMRPRVGPIDVKLYHMAALRFLGYWNFEMERCNAMMLPANNTISMQVVVHDCLLKGCQIRFCLLRRLPN